MQLYPCYICVATVSKKQFFTTCSEFFSRMSSFSSTRSKTVVHAMLNKLTKKHEKFAFHFSKIECFLNFSLHRENLLQEVKLEFLNSESTGRSFNLFYTFIEDRIFYAGE